MGMGLISVWPRHLCQRVFSFTLCRRRPSWEHVHFHTFETYGSNIRWNKLDAPSKPVLCSWVIKCLQGVLWCIFFTLALCSVHAYFFWTLSLKVLLFPSLHIISKGWLLFFAEGSSYLCHSASFKFSAFVLLCFFWLLPDMRNGAITQNVMCAAQALCNREFSFCFLICSLCRTHSKDINFA